MESEVDEETVQPKQVSEINLEYRDYEDNYETITVSSSQALSSGAVKGNIINKHIELLGSICLTLKNKSIMEPQITFIEGSSSNQEDADGEEEAMVEYSTVEVEEHENDIENEQEDGDDEDEAVALESLLSIFKSREQIRSQIVPMSMIKPPISTHVLDTSKGHPVAGLQVSLYKLIDGRWTYINEGITNADGRFANFLERNDFTPGRYKLHYDVDRYFEVRKQDSLYPFIEIVFDCRSQSDHYHVPLLLNPYGYTTYRGS
ncbi:uricase and transthyretin-related [Holotrichia oblita]|uniref:Uricase and transthyretin-related n=1 Tax=Holotrichia oblita TaxID=644536 RepID=A0ACB9TVU9_HOLOL|nr:uricase and transthyretin-related [Holotrichia oblita]